MSENQVLLTDAGSHFSSDIKRDDFARIMTRRQGIYWLLTINEDEHGEFGFNPQDYASNDRIAYIKGQLERGHGTGRRHYQVLVVLRRKGSLSTIKDLFGDRTHAELSRSSAANDYVWKEDTRIGEPFEYGSLPVQRNNQKDWDRIWDLAKAGQIDAIPSDIRITHYRTLRTIKADFAVPEAMVRRCIVFCGRTGTGKSRRAWEEAGLSAYPKDPRSKFWDGYRDQKHVVIDEFRGSIDISHMLRWLDRYPCIVEIKGASTVLVAETIWITSNLHPDYWYQDIDPATRDALFRRLEITIFE